jgi:hypothetical protein
MFISWWTSYFETDYWTALCSCDSLRWGKNTPCRWARWMRQTDRQATASAECSMQTRQWTNPLQSQAQMYCTLPSTVPNSWLHCSRSGEVIRRAMCALSAPSFSCLELPGV